MDFLWPVAGRLRGRPGRRGNGRPARASRAVRPRRAGRRARAPDRRGGRAGTVPDRRGARRRAARRVRRQRGHRHPGRGRAEPGHARLRPRGGRRGVAVLAGTDVTGTIADEVALLAGHGLSPGQAIAAAGSAARDFLGLHPEGDIVTYDENPLDDPAALKSPAAVVIRGVRVR